MNLVDKKVMGIALALVLFVGALLFRDKVSGLLLLRRNNTPDLAYVSHNPQNNVSPKAPFAEPESPPASSSKGKAGQPVYRGRDLAEVRPLAEEVKLFSQEQRAEIYTNIRQDAETLKSNPKFFDGWIHLGILKKTIGDYEGARDAWEFAGAIEPLNSTSFANLGELYWHYLNDYPKAEARFRTSIKNKSWDPLIYVSLADLYHYSYQEKKDLAPAVLLEGLKQNPGDLNLIKHLAYIYQLRGELAESLKWWTEAAGENYPYDQDVHDQIGRIKAKLGGN